MTKKEQTSLVIVSAKRLCAWGMSNLPTLREVERWCGIVKNLAMLLLRSTCFVNKQSSLVSRTFKFSCSFWWILWCGVEYLFSVNWTASEQTFGSTLWFCNNSFPAIWIFLLLWLKFMAQLWLQSRCLPKVYIPSRLLRHGWCSGTATESFYNSPTVFLAPNLIQSEH